MAIKDIIRHVCMSDDMKLFKSPLTNLIIHLTIERLERSAVGSGLGKFLTIVGVSGDFFCVN